MWAQMINVGLGLWLMAAPALIGYGDPARTNDRIVGPLVASFAVISIWEVTRPIRWVNVALGMLLLIVPWALGYGDVIETLHSFAVGALIAALAAIRGRITQSFDGGWSSLWKGGGNHATGDDRSKA